MRRKLISCLFGLLFLVGTGRAYAYGGYVYKGKGVYEGDLRPNLDQRADRQQGQPGVSRSVKTELVNFIYLDVRYVQGQLDDIQSLNRWLRTNPDKKVFSFTAIPTYTADIPTPSQSISGYILGFAKGDNSQQFFDRIFCGKTTQTDQPASVEGLSFLQDWFETHSFFTVIGFATVSTTPGGCRSFTVLYEAPPQMKAKAIKVQAEAESFEPLK